MHSVLVPLPRLWAALAVVFLLGFATLPARGQAFGTISGTITDPSGALVAGAKVTATETETSFSRAAVTDSSGHYVIPNLRPTKYSLTVEAAGFRKFVQENVLLLANQAATVDLNLQVGSAEQSVVVNEAPPLVNTTTQTLSHVIEHERMVELPLNGRNAVETMQLIPGVSSVSVSTVTSQGSPPGSTNVNVNGSRNNQTSYDLDGAMFLNQYYNVNVPFPFPDALQEFSVQTNNYSARYGGNAGGVVNVVTKSGANQFHGDLFEFVRNPVFNARPYFSNSVDQIKRNQFGGTVGGPVTIPHLYSGRDRTFFFFGYQGERYRDQSAASAFVPTTAELGGDFSALLTVNSNNPYGKVVNIVDPTTGCGFGQTGTAGNCSGTITNIIPTNRLDQAALNIGKSYLPQVGGTGQVFYTNPKVQNINQYVIRVDHKLGSRDNLVGRYYRDHIVYVPQNPKGNLLGYTAGYNQPISNVMVQETHTFGVHLLNQASFTLSDVPTDKYFAADSPNAATVGVTGLWLPTDKWIQNINISGSFAINGGAKGPFNSRNTGAEDNLSWVIGRHNLDLGVTYGHSSVDLGDLYLAQGQFTFNATTTNNQIASFMLGYLNAFTQGYGEYKNNRNNFWSFYFNDSFHATQRLTLNYGLRYEPYFPWKEIKGRVEQFRISNFNAGTRSQKYPNAPPGVLFPGDPGMPFEGVTGTYNDFAPRVGFGYNVFGNGKTSLRGGAGLFFDTQTPGVINNRFADISPFSPQVTLTPPPGPFSAPLTGYTGYYPFPFTYPPAPDTKFSLPLLVITYDPSQKYKVPVTYQWDLAVEQQLASNWMLQLAYVGAASRHQKETIELNPAHYIPGSKLTVDQRRMFASCSGSTTCFGSISMDGQDVNGNFNALEATLKKAMAQHLTLNVAYTYSKALDDVPQGGNNNDIGADSASALPWTYPNRHAFDYGPSDFDYRHRLVTSYVWKLPALTGSNALLRLVAGGWEHTGIMTVQSGGPFTALAGQDISQTGLNHDRAVQVAGVDPYKHGACATSSAHCENWLNLNAFTKPTAGNFGSVAKNSFRGPGLFGWDMGLFKNFPIKEQFAFQFRAEFFNVFNHTNLNNPTASVSSSGFGQISGAGSPRIGQLALKMQF
ncbi:MAG TPA: carboxypeptidase regulatory-like domain-containing protein [Terracidiphilus sp.]|nr:carboxypeptidase regulatory-like domain-containing protein [Terracidiphilus sp.]